MKNNHCEFVIPANTTIKIKDIPFTLADDTTVIGNINNLSLIPHVSQRINGILHVKIKEDEIRRMVTK